MQYPSKLIEDAVNEISKLPGIGKKTALRLALHLLKQEESVTDDLSRALLDLRQKTKYCRICHKKSPNIVRLGTAFDDLLNPREDHRKGSRNVQTGEPPPLRSWGK